MSAPEGNNNALKGKPWRDAINRALARRAEDHTVEGGLNNLADKFLTACEDGDQWALKELGDRVEGKSAQSITHAGDENHPLQMIGNVILRKPDGSSETD